MATKLAIVLSGGGAKGAFQVGALDELIRVRGVKPSIVVGTSTGAIQALGVAQNDIDRLKAFWLGLKGNDDIYKSRFPLFAALSGAKGLYDAKPLRKLLAQFYDPQKIAASGMALRLGVASLQSGEFQTIDETAPGLDNWVYASCAMPAYFDPLETSDGQQWVDGGVRDVTPLGAAMELNPSAVLVIRASPPPDGARDKPFNGFIPIGLRAAGILQSEVSVNDVANARLINDMIAARTRTALLLQEAGHDAGEVLNLIAPIDQTMARYHFVPLGKIEPEVEFSETLQFDPSLIRQAMDAGRKAVERNWDEIAALLGEGGVADRARLTGRDGLADCKMCT